MRKRDFWSKGIRFECQGSGNCCVSRGEYGYVFLTKSDRKALAKHFKVSMADFAKKYCDQDGGIWKLKDGAAPECVFLIEKRCTVYQARPTQCRTWPFWPDVLNARAWSKEVASFCPGVGKGRLWSKEEVEEQLRIQVESEEKYGS